MFTQKAVTSLSTRFTENDSQKNGGFGLKLAYFHKKHNLPKVRQYSIINSAISFDLSAWRCYKLELSWRM